MRKKLATFIIILTLLLILNIKTDMTIAQETGVIVDPSLIEYYTDASQQFTIAVKIVKVINLYGFDIQFKWDTKYLLEYVSHSVRVPKDDYSDGVLYKPVLDIKDDVNVTAGTYWIAKASIYPAPSFNGSGTAFTMTFRVKYHPVQPEPDANITLELYSTELAFRGGDPIPHYRQHGKVILHALEVALSHDIAVTSVHPMKTIVGQGYTININVTVANQGDFTETFNVTLYANTTTIETKQITLTNGASITLTFTWNTTGFAKGNYTIWAYAWLVPGETDTANNTLVNGAVHVTKKGDVNGDDKVNVLDLILVSLHLGHKNGDGHTPFSKEWYQCLNTDLNNDGNYNVLDLILIANNLGT